MLCKTISLNEKYQNSSLSLYVHDEDSVSRPAVVICPGGGYSFLSSREAEPIANFYYNKGMNAFVLYYSIEPHAKNYLPLFELAWSIKYIRENAGALNTNPEKIITCGFSAGGHLAASGGILWNIPELRRELGIDIGDAPEGINRPNGMILAYPVITAKEYAHRGSIINLSGNPDYGEEEIKRFSLELNVDKTTPPMFIWHTREDTCVPVQNTTLLINKYLEFDLPFEAHIYPYGEHGYSLATEQTADTSNGWGVDRHIASWAELSVMWINDTFK